MTRLLALLAIMAGGSVQAGEVQVVDVDVAPSSDDSYRFDVTLRHMDTGWEHYADRWEIVSPQGRVLARRVLHHPHVGEQPFTRTLSGVRIPAPLDHVMVRGHDSVHGYGGSTMTVQVPRE